jgi:hypothetical protein
MTKTTSKLQQALDILAGNTVVAHDRRKGDAQPIDFVKSTRTVDGKRQTVLRPLYGVSTKLQRTLEQLGTVEFTKTKRGRTMPQYVFNSK